MARVRPARNGPMLRHRNAPSKPASAVNGQSAATRKRLVSPVAIDRLVRIKNGNPLPPCSRTQEAWSALWNIDLQSVCPADLQSAETRTADNMSVGRTGHSLCSELLHGRPLCFSTVSWERLRQFFVSLLMTPDTIAEHRYADQFCRSHHD
jgi:hypothetical protein